MKDPEVFGSVVVLADNPMESVDVRDDEACSMTSLMLSLVSGKGVAPQGRPGSFGEGIASADALWKDNGAPVEDTVLLKNGLLSR